MIDEMTMRIRADELIRAALAEDVTNEDVSTACVLFGQYSWAKRN